jgi:hypothetical protein
MLIAWIRKNSRLLYVIVAIVFVLLSTLIASLYSNSQSALWLTQESISNPTPITVHAISSALSPTAQALISKPLVFPEFILSVVPQPGSKLPSPRCVTVSITEQAIWVPGVMEEQLTPHLFESFSFTLDSQSYPISNRNFLSAEGGRYKEYTNGTLVGSYGGNITACIPVRLEKGYHIVTVQVSALSGKIYSYSWAFEITET